MKERETRGDEGELTSQPNIGREIKVGRPGEGKRDISLILVLEKVMGKHGKG